MLPYHNTNSLAEMCEKSTAGKRIGSGYKKVKESRNRIRGSTREHRESTSTERALAGEQSGGTLVSDRSPVDLGSRTLYICIHLKRRVAIFDRGKEYGCF